jgi:4-hydroxybenzoate polyprenyltransferase
MPDEPESPRAAQASAAVATPQSPAPEARHDSLASRLAGLVRTMRPHQWVKNVFVLAPAVFAKEIFSTFLLTRAAAAFAVFCLLAGAVYALNDVLDREADRVHPIKRRRPIASGQVPVAWAKVLAVVLVVVSLGWAASLSLPFAGVAVLYFVQNVAYSFWLKHVPYVDVAFIAAGFVLRVIGGGLATRIDVSGYLVLCTALLAFFLGIGKRRHELTAAESNAAAQRAALKMYTKRGLDIALAVTGIATVVTYAAYTLDSHTVSFFQNQWLWPSTAFVVLGVWRFLYIVKNRPKAESPTQEMLRDGPFVATVLLWVALVMWVVYNLKPA